jgi:hypothetical protein
MISIRNISDYATYLILMIVYNNFISHTLYIYSLSKSLFFKYHYHILYFLKIIFFLIINVIFFLIFILIQ